MSEVYAGLNRLSKQQLNDVYNMQMSRMIDSMPTAGNAKSMAISKIRHQPFYGQLDGIKKMFKELEKSNSAVRLRAKSDYDHMWKGQWDES